MIQITNIPEEIEPEIKQAIYEMLCEKYQNIPFSIGHFDVHKEK